MKKNKINIGRILVYILLTIGGVFMVFPFFWMISMSLKTTAQAFIFPPEIIPKPFMWKNYIDAWEIMPFGQAYFNSFKITLICVFCQLFTASMAAFAFAKLKFPGRNVLFVIFLATMMVPAHVTIIPLFLVFQKIKLVDTHLAIILPNALFNAFGVFLLRQFIKGIPNDLHEAAIIDGASIPRIYFTIYLPLIKPALTAFGIFAFMGNWNNYLYPLIFLNSPKKFTVPILLATFKGLYVTQWTLLMAASSIAIIPVLIVYLVGQKNIIEGIALTGLKG